MRGDNNPRKLPLVRHEKNVMVVDVTPFVIASLGSSVRSAATVIWKEFNVKDLKQS